MSVSKGRSYARCPTIVVAVEVTKRNAMVKNNSIFLI